MSIVSRGKNKEKGKNKKEQGTKHNIFFKNLHQPIHDYPLDFLFLPPAIEIFFRFVPSPVASTYQLILHDKVDKARKDEGEANKGRHSLAIKLEGFLRDFTTSVPLLKNEINN